MPPGVGFGERGERAGTGELDEGDVERESWWRDCRSSPSESLILFVEILLLGVAWAFGDDMATEGYQVWQSQSSPHTSPSCAGKRVDGSVCDRTEEWQDGCFGSSPRNGLDLTCSFGSL